MKRKSYSELATRTSFEEKFEYLKCGGSIGKDTFGFDRYMNQMLYQSKEWRQARHKVILRDNGCDLGDKDHPITGRIYIHHINPIKPEDIKESTNLLFDIENLICCSELTHRAIHYGDYNLLPKEPVTRTQNDTCPWRNTNGTR